MYYECECEFERCFVDLWLMLQFNCSESVCSSLARRHGARLSTFNHASLTYFWRLGSFVIVSQKINSLDCLLQIDMWACVWVNEWLCVCYVCECDFVVLSLNAAAPKILVLIFSSSRGMRASICLTNDERC